MSSFRQSAKGLSLLERLKHSSLKVATMAMKTGLLWVRTVRVGDFAKWALDFKDLCPPLHWPPFWVGCSDFVVVARQVTASQMQNPGATVLVCKDLPDPADGFRLSLEPTLHRGLLCKIQFVYPDKTLFSDPLHSRLRVGCSSVRR